MADKFGTYHLATNPDLYEVQRSNSFEFVVTGLTSLQNLAGTGEIANAQETLRLSVVKAPIPNFKQDVLELKRGNSIMKVAGVPKFESGNLVVRDFIGANTKSALMAWQRLSYDVTSEKVGSMSVYKKDCELLEYTPSWELVRSWTLKGCWVSGISEDDFDMESGDMKSITATIEYDYAIMTNASDEIQP